MAKVYIVLEAKDKATPITRKMEKNTEQAFDKMKKNIVILWKKQLIKGSVLVIQIFLN